MGSRVSQTSQVSNCVFLIFVATVNNTKSIQHKYSPNYQKMNINPFYCFFTSKNSTMGITASALEHCCSLLLSRSLSTICMCFVCLCVCMTVIVQSRHKGVNKTDAGLTLRIAVQWEQFRLMLNTQMQRSKFLEGSAKKKGRMSLNK